MGSKKLKAIVVRGTGSIKIAKPDKLLELTRYAKALSVDSMAANCRNNGDIAYMAGRRSADEMIHKYWKKGAGCYLCPWQCNGYYDVPRIGRGYATCGQFNYGLPGVRGRAESGDDTTWLGEHKHTAPAISAKSMWEANILTQKLGINNFEIWGLTGFLWECCQESVFKIEDLGLPAPNWLGGTATEHEFLTALLSGIANRDNLFADGVARASELLGNKATEMYERIYGARGFVSHWLDGVGGVLHWATDSRDPFNSCHDYNSVMGKPAVAEYAFGSEKVAYTDLHDPHKAIYVGTERGTIITQHRQRIKNSLTLCDSIFPILSSAFSDNGLGDTSLESKLYSAVTGVNIDEEGLYQVGERIFNLERAIMVKREGRTRKEDMVFNHKFEHRFWAEEPWHLGDHWCGPIDKTKFEVLKDAYYAMRGWDKKTGWPTRVKLEELGLKEVANELESIGRMMLEPR
jgi:aldehyde:ferredoxin oxidoreductase